MVPAGGHGETGDPGEDEAGGGDEAELDEQDGGHGEEIAEAGVAECVAEGLGMGAMKSMWPREKARTELVPAMNMAQMMGEAKIDGLADGAGGVLAFAGEDGDVLEAAEGAEEHLAEEGEGDHVAAGGVGGAAVRSGVRVVSDGPGGKQDERGVDR